MPAAAQVEDVSRCGWKARCKPGVGAKDIILALIARIGIGGGTGCVFEYCGSAIRALSMEERMTVCNMSIEGGARAGLIAPDDTTYRVPGRPSATRRRAPSGTRPSRAGSSCRPTKARRYDSSITIDAAALEPMITFGTNPGMGIPITAPVPDPAALSDPLERDSLAKALRYMDLEPGKPLLGHPIDVVFIGSCTNSRISDLRSRRRRAEGPQGEPERARDGGAGIAGGQAAGAGRRARPHLPRCRRRVARSRAAPCASR